MCEPVTLTAITTSVTASIASASASAAAAASAVASAAASAATAVGSAVGTAVSTVGSALGIGGSAGGAAAGSVATVGPLGGAFGAAVPAGVSVGGTSGITAVTGLTVAPALNTLAIGLTGGELLQAATLIGGAVSATVTGVQQAEQQKQTVKAADKDSASKRIASLQSAQQGAEASAQQQFEAQRAALQAKGVVKASNLGDRSVRALSRAVGFELGQDEATITRNQEIASLETSARLFGITQERNARVGQVGSGLTVGLNAAAGGIRAGANALEIRHRLSN